MFRSNTGSPWRKSAEGYYDDDQEQVKYRKYQHTSGLELRILLMNNQYKLLCKNASPSLVTACASLPLFSEQATNENTIGMLEYTDDQAIILKYLNVINATVSLQAIQSEILIFFRIKSGSAIRAHQLEEARIYFLDKIEPEIEALKVKIYELSQVVEDYKALACEQADIIGELQAQLREEEYKSEPRNERYKLNRSF